MPLDPLTIAQAGLGVVETIGNLISGNSAKKRQKQLLSQRKAYKTPSEINQILQATEQNASYGLDPSLLQFLDKKTNAAFSSSLDVLQRLGGDPNAVSNIFGQKLDANGNIIAADTEAQMKKFSEYISALNLVADNKAAEWKSEQDIIKDKLQAEGANIAAAGANVNNGLNTIAGAASGALAMKLYGGKTSSTIDNNILGIDTPKITSGVSNGVTRQAAGGLNTIAPNNLLNPNSQVEDMYFFQRR